MTRLISTAILGIAVFFSTTSLAQKSKPFSDPLNVLSGTTWQIDGVPFETDERDMYALTSLANEDQFHWGHKITFEDSTFTSSYSAPCGVDCFSNVFGSYFFTAAHQISVTVERIDRHGFCQKQSEVMNENRGKFNLTQTETGWELSKR